MTQAFVDRDTVNDDTVIVRKIYFSSGQHVAAGSLVLEYETSKTTVESSATEAGVIVVRVKEGDEVPIGSLLYEITPQQLEAGAVVARPTLTGVHEARSVPERLLSRAAIAAVERFNVDLQDVPEGSWITANDVESRVSIQPSIGARRNAPAEQRESRAIGRAQLVAVPHNVVASTLRKRTEARNLVESNSHGAVSTLAVSVPLSGARLVRPPGFFAAGILDIVAFEIARLVTTYRELNAFYIDDKWIGYYNEINVGIAFDGGSNLKVLALRDAGRKKLCDIQTELISLLELYESDKPIPDELLTSSTVTLSDISSSDVGFMQPLLNGPQSLIVGITRAAHGFTLYASFDHRVTEGLRVARFLEQLTGNVQSHFAGAAGVSTLRCAACEKSMKEELAFGHRGLIKIALPDGGEGLLCRSCFEGV